MPILLGLIIGYVILISHWDCGLYTSKRSELCLHYQNFLIPGVDYEFNITATILLAMVPIVIVTISEHIGHQLVLGKVVNRNYIKDPGLTSFIIR